jgi:phage tail sheath gpL-like
MAIDVSAVARVVGIEAVFKDLRGQSVTFLPQRIAVIGQGATASTYATTKQQVFSAAEVGNTYGFGSPLHLAALQLFPSNGDGVGTIPVTVYPLEDDASGVAAAGDITPAGTATESGSYKVSINNIDSEEFVITATDTVATITAKITAAINAVLAMPVVATDNTTDVGLAAKWEGTSGNDIFVEVVGPSVGVTFGITQPVGGLINPDVQSALDQIGNVWETIVINCFEATDTTILDTLSTFNEGRWGETVRRPFVAVRGLYNESSVTTATATTSTRTTDRTNVQIPEPGGRDLPVTIAARAVARIAPVANNNPPKMYTAQRLTGLTAGADGDQWTFPERDAAIKGGSSTIEVVDGVVELSNVVTSYAPVGEPVPAYRFLADIVKLTNVIFNIDLIFASDEWAGAPLIPDDQPTVNPTAKKPRSAVAAVASVLDGLGLEAIISDPETAKANTFAEIDSQNPKRLNVETTVQLAGNTNIINNTVNFGFFFGTPTVVA